MSSTGHRLGSLSAWAFIAVVAGSGTAASAQQKLHYSYLWHMEQPVYWPARDRAPGSADRYELAWSSILRTDAGAANPADNLRGIFGIDDRVASYQYRMRDAINSIRWTSEGGAQISYSGGLIENINSIGSQNQLGYIPFWQQWLREARGWNTNASGTNFPRAEIVQFGFHHPLMPLIDSTTLHKELQLYKAIYPDAWGASPGPSRGLFPSEMAFSTRMIEALAQEGIGWVIVSNEHLSRACTDFPTVFGSGGVNTDAPNLADQVNPAQGSSNYYRVSISRGCSPAEAYPFAFQPHLARYVNPTTGAISTITIIPASQSLGWKDGYSPIGTSDFDALQAKNDPSRPMLVLLAHDGDNAWGGGYSYYMETVNNTASSATASGYVPTMVEKYLADHPVPANDYVHVEDGAWVNADGDFGSPQMINWNWPPLTSTGTIDVPNGWHVDIRNWAVITAANNRVETAEQIATRAGGPQAGGLTIRRILYPDGTTTAAERAWHYFLGSLNSGYMYYGTAGDMEVKQTVACNQAVINADSVIGDASLDTTAPTVWAVQRQPWNPGSVSFGPQYAYQQVNNNGDFYIWTFAYDVSGVTTVNLKYRIENQSTRSLSNTENETYAGGPTVGAWQTMTMTKRVFPAGNVYNDSSINFTVSPTYIADEYYAQVTGIRSKMVDYYVEATDAKGNLKKSPIQHVWVGAGSGGGGGGGGSGPTVAINPATPVATQTATITYNPSGRNLAAAGAVKIHYGINTWTGVPSPDPAMTKDNATGNWTYTLIVPSTASTLNVCFNDGGSTWDSNSGANWNFTVTGTVTPPPPWVMDGTLDSPNVITAASNGGRNLSVGLRGTMLYVAGPNCGSGNDAFIFVARQPGTLQTSPWGKSGQVAAWDVFLAAENNNTFAGWTGGVTGLGPQVGRGASGVGLLEGAFDLNTQFAGVIPASIYVAYANYPTNDATALIPSLQIPASSNGNTTLEAIEWVKVDLCQFSAAGCATCKPNYSGSGCLGPVDLLGYLSLYFTDADGHGSGVAGPGGYAVACDASKQSAVPPVVTAAGLKADYDGDCQLATPDLLGFLNDYFNPSDACFSGCGARGVEGTEVQNGQRNTVGVGDDRSGSVRGGGAGAADHAGPAPAGGRGRSGAQR